MKIDNLTVGILVSTYNWPEALESILLSILRQSLLPMRSWLQMMVPERKPAP